MNELDIPIVDTPPKFDANKYHNTKARIAKVTKGVKTDFYPDGKTYNPDSIATVPIIEIETEPLETVTYKDGTKKDITVKARFTLQVRETEDGKIEVIISKHPKARLWKFMRLMGVMKLDELKGKFVKIVAVPAKEADDDRVFLRIWTGE